MNGSVTVGGREINYELNIKNVKNINLRIRKDGSVTISANRRVPLYVIENFIREKSEFVFRAQDKFGRREKIELRDGATFSILGKEYKLLIEKGRTNRADIVADVIKISVTELCEECISASLARLCARVCESVIPPICHRLYMAYIEPRGIAYPQIKYRKMKSRWGSCNCMKGIVTFNTSLACTSLECIEFVVAHELSHLLHSDHSAKFYSELAKMLPDHKERNKALKQYCADF